jgi:HAD superfamily hydrolase (TIGR01549 family)
MSELIEGLKVNGIKVGIITDGRVSGQRKKIEALGLDKKVDDYIITDELGGIQFRKPCDIAFRIIQNRWRIPFEQIMYVGDNAEKDFQAPRQLGMRSLWFRNKDGLYQSEANGVRMTENINEYFNTNK